MTVTEKQMHILRHMLGVDSNRPPNRWGFRNHFVADPDGPDDKQLQTMLANGLVERGQDISGGRCYHATDAGCELVGLSPDRITVAMGREKGEST